MNRLMCTPSVKAYVINGWVLRHLERMQSNEEIEEINESPDFHEDLASAGENREPAHRSVQ